MPLTFGSWQRYATGVPHVFLSREHVKEVLRQPSWLNLLRGRLLLVTEHDTHQPVLVQVQDATRDLHGRVSFTTVTLVPTAPQSVELAHVPHFVYGPGVSRAQGRQAMLEDVSSVHDTRLDSVFLFLHESTVAALMLQARRVKAMPIVVHVLYRAWDMPAFSGRKTHGEYVMRHMPPTAACPFPHEDVLRQGESEQTALAILRVTARLLRVSPDLFNVSNLALSSCVIDYALHPDTPRCTVVLALDKLHSIMSSQVPLEATRWLAALPCLGPGISELVNVPLAIQRVICRCAAGSAAAGAGEKSLDFTVLMCAPLTHVQRTLHEKGASLSEVLLADGAPTRHPSGYWRFQKMASAIIEMCGTAEDMTAPISFVVVKVRPGEYRLQTRCTAEPDSVSWNTMCGFDTIVMPEGRFCVADIERPGAVAAHCLYVIPGVPSEPALDEDPIWS